MSSKKRTKSTIYDDMLGRIPDADIAKLLGVSVQTISARRYKLGIACHSKKVRYICEVLSEYIINDDIRDIMGQEVAKLSKLIIKGDGTPTNLKYKRFDWEGHTHLLGTMTDKDLANKLGCETHRVTFQRQKLGIKGFNVKKGRKGINWDEHIELLGTIPDSDIAKQLGCTTTYVCIKRNELGIKSFRGVGNSPSFDWKEFTPLFTSMNSTDIAWVIGRSVSYIDTKRHQLGIKNTGVKLGASKIHLFDNVLGTVPDNRIANLCGCGRTTVRRRRAKLNIAKFNNNK
jgi:hypothetical protein